MIYYQLIIISFFCQNAFFEIGSRHIFNFCVFHHSSSILTLSIIVTSYNKLSSHRKFLGSQTKSLFRNIKRNTFYFYQDASRSNRSNKALRITFTFTHTYLSRLFRNRFIRENTNPDLSLTLHISSNSNTGGFYLATSNPFALQRLDAK